MQSLEAELDVEKSKRILEYEQMIRDQSDVLAREIIGTAIQQKQPFTLFRTLQMI